MKKTFAEKIRDNDPLKILVVSPLYEDDKDNYLNFDFLGDWETEVRLITNEQIPETLSYFRENGFDALVNLCDAYEHPVQPGLKFLELLEKEKILFTGTSSDNYAMTKLDTKKAGKYAPGFVFVNSLDLTKDQFQNLNYPLLVKPNLGGGSYGIDEHSKVNNFEEVRAECKRKLPQYPELIVEEFIDGREFTALVIENDQSDGKPICFEPVECVFKTEVNFKSENVKWAEDDFFYEVPKVVELNDKIKRMCEEVFSLFNLDGYVRMDIRANRNNDLYITDINPYCAIFSDESSSDFILESNRHLFRSNKELVLHLIKCGYNRQLKNLAKVPSI